MPSVSPAAAALAFAICALAVYRLSVLLTIEDGPWRLCARWRAAVFAWRERALATPDGGWGGGLTSLEDDWIAAGVQCPWCCSWWLALPAALAWAALTGAPPVLAAAAWPALSAPVVLLWRPEA